MVMMESMDHAMTGNREALLPEPEPLQLLHEMPLPSCDYPNVFHEAKDMILSAILIYGVIDLRALAKQGLLDNTKGGANERCYLLDQLLQLPVSAKDVVRLVARHRAQIEQHIGRESTELYLDAFDSIQSSSSSRELELEFCRGQVSLVDFTVRVVQDDNSATELVYAICVDTARRRITVLFRGCSTRTDWIICANNLLKEVPNPLCYSDYDDKFQSQRIAIHSGYCDYLFNASHQESGSSKFEELLKHLQSLQREFPGYQVYVTGHSLGAAMATVFSFQAAATRQLDETNPITCINFASPMVGNLAFETAFRQLEGEGRIRCLRVTNHFDIFTQLPDRGNWLYAMACFTGLHPITYVGWSLLFFLFFQKNVYRHVGMDLHIYKHRQYAYTSWLSLLVRNRHTNNHNNDDENNRQPKYSYKVKHSRGTPENFAWRVALDWKKHFKQALQRTMMVPFVLDFNTNHSVQEHLLRLTGLANQLEFVYLEDLYNGEATSMRSPSTMTTNTLVDAATCCFA